MSNDSIRDFQYLAFDFCNFNPRSKSRPDSGREEIQFSRFPPSKSIDLKSIETPAESRSTFRSRFPRVLITIASFNRINDHDVALITRVFARKTGHATKMIDRRFVV